MGFTAKIVMAGHVKQDGTSQMLLQAYINRQRAVIPLGFCLPRTDFDKRRQGIKPSNPNAESFLKEFQAALAKAHGIASKMRNDGRTITPLTFRNEYNTPTESMDVIKFIARELELKRPVIAINTYKQHTTLVNKLSEFSRSGIAFNEIDIELIQNFRNKLVKDGNGPSTVEKTLKNFKQYLAEARKKGMLFKEVHLKIKQFKSNRPSLTQEEVDKLDAYYNSLSCLPAHKKLLRYFLFSCSTGIRISDISVITWKNVDGDWLTFTPVKTKKNMEMVKVPLVNRDKQYLPEYKDGNAPIFDTFADAVSNRYLKDIARLECVKINKKITYHTSRHTFGSLFAEGGNIVALQKLMGHSDVKTTMGYVHTSSKALSDAKRERFGK